MLKPMHMLMALPRFDAAFRSCAFALIMAASATAPSAFAVVQPRKVLTNDSTLFPKPAIVRKQVRFWEKIFGKYPSTTVIVHEADDLDRIIDIIDYKVLSNRKPQEGPASRKQREEVTSKYLQRYNLALERFANEGKKATRYGAIEQRVYDVYRGDEAGLRRLYKGQIKIRTQTGLADDFVQAAARAQAYFPYMETIFKRYGIPKALTRLPFVESMFNLKARSKVGASGLWQFMPQTARHFVYVNKLVDERNSPYKATRAAAQFLYQNYRDLKSWPLAITAYNHGRSGMERAVKQLGTKDIGRIISRYDSSSFGFASRNFYAEFLAAVSVYDRIQLAGRATKSLELPPTEAIVLQDRFSVNQLVAHTPLTKEIISTYNPCLLETTLSQYVNHPLPPFYELYVPRHLAGTTKTALLNLKARAYARR